MEVASTWNNGSCKVNDRSLIFSLDTMSQAIFIPNEEPNVCKEGKINKLDARNKFLEMVLKTKELEKYQTRVVRNFILKPLNDVVAILIKYVTLEGIYKILLASHFFMLNHFIFLKIDNVNFPFFIFNSLSLLIEKVKRNRALGPLHGVVIKLVYNRSISLSLKKSLGLHS